MLSSPAKRSILEENKKWFRNLHVVLNCSKQDRPHTLATCGIASKSSMSFVNP
jgi:hypothetical protein